jgi:hypothetical protein
VIKLTYAQVVNGQFVYSMQKLVGSELPFKTAYHIKRIADKLNSQRKVISAEYEKDIASVFAKKNADGTRVSAHPSTGRDFEVAEDQLKAFEEAQTKFGERTFVIDKHPINPAELAGATFTAIEVSSLEPLFANTEGVAPTALKAVTPIADDSATPEAAAT